MFDNWDWENNWSSSDVRIFVFNEKSREMLEAKNEFWNISVDESFALNQRSLDSSSAGTVKLN